MTAFLFDLLAITCVLIGLGGLLYSAVQEGKGCPECGGREGWLCWFILIAFLAALGVMLLGLLILAMVLCCAKSEYGPLDFGMSGNGVEIGQQQDQIRDYNLGISKGFV